MFSAQQTKDSLSLLVYLPVHTCITGVGLIVVHYPLMLKTINGLFNQPGDFHETQGLALPILEPVETT